MRLRRDKAVLPCPPCRVDDILTHIAFVAAIVGTDPNNPNAETEKTLLSDLLDDCAAIARGGFDVAEIRSAAERSLARTRALATPEGRKPCRMEEILTQLAFVGAIVGTGTSNPDTTTAAILLKDLLCECENCPLTP